MHEQWKAKWIDALRSGKYEQGRGSLHPGDKYCCLGVICDVIDPTGWQALDKFTSIMRYYGVREHKYDGNEAKLTRNIREQIGLRGSDMEILIDMNDERVDFITIAKWIKNNL